MRYQPDKQRYGIKGRNIRRYDQIIRHNRYYISTGLSLTTFFGTAGWNNEVKTNTTDTGLAAPYGAGAAFDLSATSGSLAASGAVTSGKLNSFLALPLSAALWV